MVLLGKIEININDINIKKKLKYSSDFSFVGLSYEKKDILFQTPKLYTKYGINDKYNKNFIDLSLQNIDNDNSIKTISTHDIPSDSDEINHKTRIKYCNCCFNIDTISSVLKSIITPNYILCKVFSSCFI